MAVKFSTNHERGSVYKFWPKDLVIKPELNGRHDPPDITELKQSIKKNGQIDPVTVRKENGQPVLVIGFSRYRSISELNAEYPDQQRRIICVYTTSNEQDAYVANWAENRARSATTAMDDAHQFSQMLKWEWTTKEIAEACGVKEPFVKARLKLISADRSVQKAVSTGRIKPTAAAKLAELPSAQQRDAVAGEGKVTNKKIAEVSGRPGKATMKEIREVLEEAVDIAETVAVKLFAKKLLARINGEREP